MFGVFISLSLLPLAANGPPEHRHVRLTYVVAADIGSCPSETELEQSVVGRLGYDPFSPKAAEQLRATLEPDGHGLTARVERLSASGTLLGARTLHSDSRDCTELANALTLAISIAIDPLALTRPAPPKIADSTVVLLPAQPPPPPPPAPKPSLAPSFEASVAVVGAVASAPSPSLGAALGVALRWPRWSLGLEGRADLPAGISYGGGWVSASLIYASILPCYRTWHLGLCLTGAVGAEEATATGLPGPSYPSSPYVAAGARAFIDLPVTSFLALTAQLEGLAPLAQTTIKAEGANVWTTPPFTGSLALGVRFAPGSL